MTARTSPPSPALPLAYMVMAMVAFVLAAVALPAVAPALAGHYYHPRVLALAHTVTLGWITLTIVGATHQLIPIILKRPVASERLARWVLPVFALGVIGVVGHFWIAEWRGFVCSAALLAVAALAHVVNTGAGVVTAPSSFSARMVGVALAGLALTVLFGSALGADRVWSILPGALFPRLHAHVHLALLGFVLPMVLGVAAHAYPMFLHAPEPAGVGARVQLAGIVAGVPIVVSGLLADLRPAVVLGALLVAAATLTHVSWVLWMVRARRGGALDWPLRFLLAGALALVPATAMGLALAADLLAGPRMALAYAVLALGGWASLTIVGMLLKIVPFLVWYRVYAPLAGRSPVPVLAQLSWRSGEAAAFALLVPGIVLLAAAVALGDVALIRMAGVAVALGALAFAATMTQALRHLLPAPRRAGRPGSAVSAAPSPAASANSPRHACPGPSPCS